MNHDTELRQFAEAVKSIAASLAKDCDAMLMKSKDQIPASQAGDPSVETHLKLPSLARTLYKARRARDDIAPERDLFQNPAWDILLDLYIAHSEDKYISVTSASLAANVPLTTALRWVWHLEQLDLIARKIDPSDRRRSFVSLTSTGLVMIERALTDTYSRFNAMFLQANPA